MVEMNNLIQRDIIRSVHEQEAKMRSLCHALPQDRYMMGNEDALDAITGNEKVLPVYIDKTTESKLTYGNALVTLANFVTAIPTDSDELQYPTYAVTSSGPKFVAEVLLPAGAPFRSSVGDPHSRKSLAKRSAAFKACMELRRKSHLDGHLLPTYAKKLPAMRNAHLAVTSKKTFVYDMRTKPRIWEESRDQFPVKLFVTVIDFPDGLEREHQPFAMLTRTPMSRFPGFPIFLDDGKESQVVSYPPTS